MSDPYQVLGVPYDATDEEIKRAYHALARRYHPDGFADDAVKREMATRKMCDVNAAYEQIVADRARGVRGAAAYTGGASAAPPPTEPAKAAQSDADKGKKPKGKKEKKGSTANADPRYRSYSDRRQAEEEARFVGYPYVRTLLGMGNYAAALGELYRVGEPHRVAQWHYLAGCAHIGMRHLHDALREIGLACRMEPKNEEYKKARADLKEKAAQFGKRRDRAEAQAAENRKKTADPCKKCCFCSLGIDDGKC